MYDRIFFVSREHPDFRMRSSKEWEEIKLSLGKRDIYKCGWKSFNMRVRWLIHSGTIYDQIDRLDFDVLAREIRMLVTLSRLRLEDVNPRSADLISLEALAEEILARGLDIENFQWDPSAGSGAYVGARGVVINISIEEHKRVNGIRLNVRKQFDGMQSFSTVRKYWSTRQREIEELLRKNGWSQYDRNNISREEISLSFFMSDDIIWGNSRNIASSLGEVWKKLDMA